LLQIAASAAVGLIAAPAAARPQSSDALEPIEPPWWLKQHAPLSRVVELRSSDVLEGDVVDEVVLGEMIDQGLQKLTDTAAPADAWKKILGDARRIVLKFNRVAAGVLGTSDVMASVLVSRLSDAGYDPASLMLVETPPYLAHRFKTMDVPRGWGGWIRIGNRPEQLARYVEQSDAIINVPFLKTHQIAGISCGMKNISHAVIRRPAHYHANGCSPAVPQVLANKPVSEKIRLNLVNALRIVVDRGPDATEDDVVSLGGLLFGFDPLAVDQIGLSALAIERRRLSLPGEINVRYLAAAARMKLGRWRPEEIERISLDATV